MLIQSKFSLYLLLLLVPFLIPKSYSTSELLQTPEREVIRISSSYTMLDVMKYELRKYENNLALESFETTKGGLSAQLVVMSPNYVARLSSSAAHVLEANQFDSFVRTAQIEKANLEDMGFKLCLPLSVFLVADETDESRRKTTSSVIVMPRAKGTTLFKHLVSGMPIKEKAEMLFNLGKSLALFQVAFVDEIEGQYYTAAHGDFHEGNIFGALRTGPYVSSNKWAFSLIDCAGLTLKGMHPLMDPLYFIYRANYVLFNSALSYDALSYLTRSFYTGYLRHLPFEFNKMLYSLLPNWRKIASTELTRSKGLLFFNTNLPNASSFLSLFETLNLNAARSVFTSLGYGQEFYPPRLRVTVPPYHLAGGQYYATPVGALVAPKKTAYDCAECRAKIVTPSPAPQGAMVQQSPAVVTTGPILPSQMPVPNPAVVPQPHITRAELTPLELGGKQQIVLKVVKSFPPKAEEAPALKGSKQARAVLKGDEITVRSTSVPAKLREKAQVVEIPAPIVAPKVVKDKDMKKVRRHSIAGALMRQI